jgi:hypothetical protein
MTPPPDAPTLDVGTRLIGLSLWAITAIPAYVTAARLIGRQVSPAQTVPARLWLALFLIWTLAASLASGAGLGWLAWPLLAGQIALAARLATARGWASRPAWVAAGGAFAGFALYALAGGLILRATGAWATWAWWLLLPPVWVTWLRVPTIPIARPLEEPPA